MSGTRELIRKQVPLLLAAAVMGGLVLIGRWDFPIFHSLAELFSIIVAAAIFMLAWNGRRFLDNDYLLFLGIAYLFIGGLDLLHTMAYKGVGFFPGRGSNLPTQLWVSARYLESISLLTAPVFLVRRLRPALAFGSFAAVFAAVALFTLQWRFFPICYVEGKGLTSFKIVSEYVVCGILTAALAVLFGQRRRLDPRVWRLLAGSIVMTIASEITFTHYVSVFGWANLIGHLLKLGSFFLLYQALIATALIRPYQLLFRDLKGSQQELRGERDFISAVLDTAAALVVVLDRDGRIVRFNRACERATGYSFQEVQGKCLWELLLDPGEIEPAKAHFAELRAGRFPGEHEHLWVARDGTRRTIAWTNAALPDESGNVAFIISTGLDVTERKRAERQLQELNATLEQRVAERTSVIEQRAVQLRALAAELTQAEQRERRRLAGLLHDHLQQLLVGARFGLDTLKSRLREQPLRDSLRQVDELLAQSIGASKSLASELSPPILYDGGLAAALEWLGEQMRERHGLTVRVRADERADPAAEDVAVLCFQAVRELLFNVVKHARTDAAEVSMSPVDGRSLRIVVADRGAGFDASAGHGRGENLGLFGIRERIESIGGQVEIDSAPGRGTRVTLQAPLRQAATNQEP